MQIAEGAAAGEAVLKLAKGSADRIRVGQFPSQVVSSTSAVLLVVIIKQE